ncbi:LysR family transcriptional regulator [Ohessyouella blattaphilus]|uniref:LysR family transcriptional regulator n=1 Tax=Ohessyouella blattaphilus TaxID=2949333 RepID=A0ABT1EKY2_9FIRM|nr:LysR family transcriptional regulator [Ohessyouella blattaphilus]MCP1111369.1 LysR family transcriptional regulator [Ohessyouella blattaphilus]MCR8564763.1 LysR family transcriptional regulator [Ohessyouella blattaphilus]
MEIKYLHTLKTVLDSGSYLKAAERLGYTQSTVTFQMQQLEQELSLQLFEKIGRKMVLTQAGRDILPIVEDILCSVDRLTTHGKKLSQIKGTLKVAMPESLLTYQMQPVLKAFRAAAPGVTLSMRSLNCYAIRDQITNGEVDIGIHYDVGGYGKTIITEKISEHNTVFIASPALSGTDKDFITPHQKKDICLIYSDPSSLSYKTASRYLTDRDILMASEMELWSTEALKRSVISNLGVALIPEFAVADELKKGLLQVLPLPLERQTTSVMITHHKNKWISPAMETFIQLAREYSQ